MKTCSILLLSFITLIFISCSGIEGVNADQSNDLEVSDRYCQEWEKRYNALIVKQKESFQKEKIIRDENYLLDKHLVKDCQLRLEIGTILKKALSDSYSEDDKKFAFNNSKEIVDVLRVVWNSENYASDGAAPMEKTSLLYSRGIDDKEITPFIGELIIKEGFFRHCEICLEPYLPYILIKKPRPSLDSLVSRRLKIDEENENLLNQTFALMILSNNDPSEKYISKLQKIRQNKKLSKEKRKSIKKIILKIKAKKKLNEEDVEDFYLDYIS